MTPMLADGGNDGGTSRGTSGGAPGQADQQLLSGGQSCGDDGGPIQP